MLGYCMKCRERADNKNPRVAKTTKGKIIILIKCAVYDTKKLRFIKEQEACGLFG